MSHGVQIALLIGECLICFIIILVVSVIFVRRERNSNFKSKDPSMFYPNDQLYGKGWDDPGKVSPEDQKKITAAYAKSLAEYNASGKPKSKSS